MTNAAESITTEELEGELERSGKVQLEPRAPNLELTPDEETDELTEMRVIAKRLKALDPGARRRVLGWLVARFGT